MKKYFLPITFIIGFILIFYFYSCQKMEKVSRVKTDNISVDSSKVTAKGTILDIGPNEIKDYGFCWSATENPTINDNKKSLGIAKNRGEYNSTFSETNANTYHIRAYISDDKEVKYGEDKTFKIDYFINSIDTILIPKDTGTVTINIKSNTQWSAVSGQTWLTLNNSSGSNNGIITAHYSGNTSNTSRNTTIQITGNLGTHKTITVIQSSYLFTVSPQTINVACTASTTSFNITSNSTWSCSSDQTWCTLNPTNGNNNGTVTVNYSANSNTTSRVAIITVTGTGGATQTVTLTQAAFVASLSVSPSTLNVAYTTSSTSFSITSNVSWSCSSNQTWCTINPSSGSNNNSISVNCSANSSTSRTASITVTGTGVSSQTVTIIQAGVPSLPTVTTSTITNVSYTTASGGGNVTSDGGATVSTRGICWSTSQNPTISNSHTTDGSSTGNFSSSLTGLTSNITYYVRAYATNNIGTAYGNQVNFTTLFQWTCGSTLSDYDGNTYNTVQIGTQCWMKESLKSTHYSNGSSISNVSAYDNNVSNVITYGRLYTWAAAMNGASSSNTNPSGVQGVCPSGWHLPSDAEFDVIASSLGGVGVAAGKMKESGTSHWTTPNTGASNESGFTALPSGFYDSASGTFAELTHTNYLLTTREYDATQSYVHYMFYVSAELYIMITQKQSRYSIRCIKD